ncbi:spore cortex-lytic enzyme-like [Bradysia coprophila]|uniref:spore cortex-lytic enzyme-like n=1 Tax=Bradysia coprophila TaxID=38358 RepID=UPI00187DD658|nr:spore cortex-lytic enzyme-like [Bradysia coprophila]
MSDKDILAQTVYHEARGESEDGWKAVAHVIKNRAKANKSYWGGNSVARVCKQPGQFECWDGRNTEIKETSKYNQIKKVTDQILDDYDSYDLTNGADHYNNPDKEGYPGWTKNCDRKAKIGNHQFYETKREFK